MEQGERFDMWGIAEVMGHRKYAGHITEQTIGGAALIRVDVPEVLVEPRYSSEPTKQVAAYTKLIGVGSIYCITPTTELARYDSDPLPVSLPVERQISASVGVTDLQSGAELDNGDYNDDDEPF